MTRELLKQALEALDGWMDQPDTTEAYDAALDRAQQAAEAIGAELATPERVPVANNDLALKVLERMALCYRIRPADVATACDVAIDRSGNLLGWIREAARHADPAG